MANYSVKIFVTYRKGVLDPQGVAVEKAAQGTLFEVLCDDPETLHDIPALCDRMGLVLLGVSEDAGEYAFRIEKR